MKTPLDPRHRRRREAVKELFTQTFNQPVANPLALAVLNKKEPVDEVIAKCAPLWPIDKLNRIDLAILRLAVYEIVVDKKEPIKVIIDEAVELAKEFGSESSPSFINGVLGAVVNDSDKRTNRSGESGDDGNRPTPGTGQR